MFVVLLYLEERHHVNRMHECYVYIQTKTCTSLTRYVN